MRILDALGQLLLFLLGNGAALAGLPFFARWLGRCFRKRMIDDVKKPQSLAVMPPVDRGWSLPDFSPGPVQLLVRDTARPQPRQPRNRSAAPPIFFLLLPTIYAASLPAPVQAQTADHGLTLPEIHVEAPGNSCVDVEVGGRRQPAFECLNAQLKAAAQSGSPSDPNSALEAVVGKGEPNKVGTFSYTGESIRMGDNFGKSAFPQRPPAPVYSNSLTAGVK